MWWLNPVIKIFVYLVGLHIYAKKKLSEYLMLVDFHGSNSYANTSRWYVTRTLPVLFLKVLVLRLPIVIAVIVTMLYHWLVKYMPLRGRRLIPPQNSIIWGQAIGLMTTEWGLDFWPFAALCIQYIYTPPPDVQATFCTGNLRVLHSVVTRGTHILEILK